MNIKYQYKAFLLILFFIAIANPGNAQTSKKNQIEQRNIEAQMEFLASDAMQGRGSGTQFEWITAEYFASMMKQFGISPAGETDSSGKKTFLQTVTITQNSFIESPTMKYSSNGTDITLEHGKEMLVYQISSESIIGKFQKVNVGTKPIKGAILFISADDEKAMQNLESLTEEAAALIIEENPQRRAGWERFASRKVSFTNFGKTKPNSSAAIIIVGKDTANTLANVADGTQIEIGGKLDEPKIKKTWNAAGMIEGSDAKLSSEVILLSAHLDHLGVRENAPGEDKIFNGADDDASGCVAVLELARILAQEKRPKRTVYFVFFGSEEAGGFGSRYFVDNLPFPKEKLIANLQWEMLGRPDAKVGKDELWLTGYDRSNLGVELAKHGAKLVNDPHPEENFFQRSDNYTLARQGIIAHTVSSFGLHKDYHQASDEIKTIDFEYMTQAINSMIIPVQWLLNSDFKPTWYEGKKP